MHSQATGRVWETLKKQKGQEGQEGAKNIKVSLPVLAFLVLFALKLPLQSARQRE
jgi:hypothetical protein